MLESPDERFLGCCQLFTVGCLGAGTLQRLVSENQLELSVYLAARGLCIPRKTHNPERKAGVAATYSSLQQQTAAEPVAFLTSSVPLGDTL